MSSLDDANDDLISRLDDTRPAVGEYKIAKEAVEEAKTEKDRSTYDEAHELVAALSVSNKRLTQRLDSLDTEITEIEEEERLAAEKVAEEERRIAAEKEAEATERQVAQKATQKSS